MPARRAAALAGITVLVIIALLFVWRVWRHAEVLPSASSEPQLVGRTRENLASLCA